MWVPLLDVRDEKQEQQTYLLLHHGAHAGTEEAVRLHKRILQDLVATDEEIFEALEVVETFHKNTKFIEGLQLEPSLWAEP